MEVPVYISGPLSWKADFYRKGQGSRIGNQVENKRALYPNGKEGPWDPGLD